MPFISCVTLIRNFACETVPPHNPGLCSVILSPGIAIPSRHHDNSAGGLLELESQCNVASIPGINSGGSTEILTVSGATIIEQIEINYHVKIICTWLSNWFNQV